MKRNTSRTRAREIASAIPADQIVGMIHNTMLPNARFGLGRVVATPGAREAVTEDEMLISLARHVRGDWGDVPKDDKRMNDSLVDSYAMLASSYRAKDGTKFFIITDADRLLTTVLLPNEY